MKRSSTVFLQIVVFLIAIGALAALILEPQTEGRNAHADLVTIYFRDPFLAYVYIASVPFFVALYQAFKLLSYIDRNEIFSQGSVRAVRVIRYCATAIVALILGAEAYIIAFQRGKDDIAGGVAMGLFMLVVSVIIATAAAVFQKLLQSGVDIKSENDLTV